MSYKAEMLKALAKSVTHHDKGDPVQAYDWALRLIRLLEAEGILPKDFTKEKTNA